MSTCNFCQKEFSRPDSKRRHENKCKSKQFLQDNGILDLVKKMMLNQTKLEEKNLLLEEKNLLLEEKNLKLENEISLIKSQLSNAAPAIINSTVNGNVDQSVHNNYQINISCTPVLFGDESTKHISEKQVKNWLKNLSPEKCIIAGIKAIYNNHKIPDNMTVRKCPCDSSCDKVLVYKNNSWIKSDIDSIAGLIVGKSIDSINIYHTTDEEDAKIRRVFDSEKNFPNVRIINVLPQ